jgi:hypothetical protein
MSQSDLINYKKISNVLLEMKKLDSVLSSQDYIMFKQYTLESKIANSKPVLNQLVLSGNSCIFGMEKNISKCSGFNNFILCNKTNTRNNRVLRTMNIPNILNQHPEKQII